MYAFVCCWVEKKKKDTNLFHVLGQWNRIYSLLPNAGSCPISYYSLLSLAAMRLWFYVCATVLPP